MWGAFLAVPAEGFDSFAELLRAPEAAGMAEAVAALETGALLPALLLRQDRPIEAARTSFELATRRTLLPLSEGGATERPERRLELRLSSLQQAIHAARLALTCLGGAEVAASLGVDFLRNAEKCGRGPEALAGLNPSRAKPQRG